MSVTGYLFPEITLDQAQAWNYFMQFGESQFHLVEVENKQQFILVDDNGYDLHAEMCSLCRLLKLPYRQTLMTIHAPSKYVEF